MLEYILANVSTYKLGAIVLGCFLLMRIVARINENKRISNLGARAPAMGPWYYFGLDTPYRSIRAGMKNQSLQLWQDLFRDSGKGGFTCEGRILGFRLLFTADPENIKAILATQFKDYGKGQQFTDEWRPFLGESIFSADGDMWHNSRQLLRPQFIRDRISDLEIFEKHVQTLIDMIPGTGEEFDLADLLYRYTLDAATDFLLGASVDSLTQPKVEFATAFGEIQHHHSIMSRLGPLRYLLPGANYNKNIKALNDFIEPYIERTLQLSPEELETISKKEQGYSLLHAIAGHTRDRQFIRDQVVAVLLGGRDTTAATLSWTFWELAHDDRVFTKLRREIITRVGPHRKPTYEDLKEMKYLQNVLNEILRLYPVVPANVRFSLVDTTLPTGGGPNGDQPIGILKNTGIGYTTLAMQRRRDLFGPTADDFNPERWETWTPKPWQYIPFNGGPRICIGQQFALTEMGYTLVRMLQKFDTLEIKRAGGRIHGNEMRMDITLSPAKGVPIGMHAAK